MVLVIDLDNTLCRSNTFRLWTIAAFLLPNRVTGFRYPRALLHFCLLYLLRFTGVITHPILKTRFISLWEKLPVDKRNLFNRQFADFLVEKLLHRAVVKKIDELKTDQSRLILATAAPRFYASFIADRLGMECLASDFTEESWRENFGDLKKESVYTMIGAAPFILFTDHRDDWSLIAEAQKTFLVNPDKKLLGRVKAEGLNVETIYG